MVAGDPEAESVIECTVLTEAADGAVIFFRLDEGQRIGVICGVVDNIESGGFTEDLEGGLDGDGLFELGADGDGVGAVDGDADAGDAGPEGWVVHDFPTFVFHFHFFPGVAGGEEGIDVGEDVEGDLVGVDFAGDGLVICDLVYLIFEFFDGFGAGAGDGLVTGGEDAFAMEGLMERVEGHEGDCGGAVRIGKDAVMTFDVLGVDLRDDEGDGVVHPEGAGVVDDHAAGFDGGGSEGF
ncbi:MAG: hypothetical protein RI897_4315 [Verrucomicrobiota bacterium]